MDTDASGVELGAGMALGTIPSVAVATIGVFVNFGIANSVSAIAV
jgi:hypothetical protein